MGETGATDRTPRWQFLLGMGLTAAFFLVLVGMPFAAPTSRSIARRAGESLFFASMVGFLLAVTWSSWSLQRRLEAMGTPSRTARARATSWILPRLFFPLIGVAAIIWIVRWTAPLPHTGTPAADVMTGFVERAGGLLPGLVFGGALAFAFVGRVVGSGLHCAKCRYPVVDPGGVCTECGAWLGGRKAMTEGLIERRPWAVALAAATLAAVALLPLARSRVVSITPNAMLLRAAASPSFGTSYEAVEELETRALTSAEQTRLAHAVVDSWEASPERRLHQHDVLERSLAAGLVKSDDIGRIVALAAETINDLPTQLLLRELLSHPLSSQQSDLLAAAMADAIARDDSAAYMGVDWLARVFASGDLSAATFARLHGLMRGKRDDDSSHWIWMWYRTALAASSGDIERLLIADCLESIRRSDPPKGSITVRRETIDAAERLGMLTAEEAEDLRHPTMRPVRSRIGP